MPTYQYQAVDKDGNTLKDSLIADHINQAKGQLTQRGLMVFELKETNASAKKHKAALSQEQKMLWIRQLSTLLSAGYTLEKALKSCGRQSQDPHLQNFTQSIHRRVVEGIPFHRALADYPKVFDDTFCATIKAGESSGHLDVILERLANYAENAALMRDNIRQALIYPLILSLVATALIAYLMTAVIPDVVKIFTSSGTKLPIITQILLTISHIIGNYGVFILALFTAVIYWLKKLAKHPKNQWLLHQKQLRLAFIGKAITAYHTANFAATLAILLNSGVKLIQAMHISRQTLSNVVMQDVAAKACEKLQKGQSLARALQSEENIFPSLFLELIDSGERTGKLSPMLSKAADIYHQQSQSRLRTITNLLAPMMILLMGAIIFVIVLAILLPIFDLNQTISIK